MVEILSGFDDFFKVRETLTRIELLLVKRRRFINLATFSISREDISLFTLRSCLL